MEPERRGVGNGDPERDDATRQVHVRRLDVMDTLRWSREVLSNHRKLLGVGFAVNLLSVLATVGVSRPAPSATPEIADWVAALLLVQLVAVLIVGGVFSLVAEDAVGNSNRPFRQHFLTSLLRLPALVATTFVMGILVGLSLLPAVVTPMVWPEAAIGLLLVPISVYVFLRLLLAYPACVIDGTGPVASARVSWVAATGIVRKVFAVGIVYVLSAVASNVVAGLFGSRYDVASTLVSAAFGAVILPFFGLALAHLYLEGSRNR